MVPQRKERSLPYDTFDLHSEVWSLCPWFPDRRSLPGLLGELLTFLAAGLPVNA